MSAVPTGREQLLHGQALSLCWVAGTLCEPDGVFATREQLLAFSDGFPSGFWLSIYSQDNLLGMGDVNIPNLVM